MRTLAETYLRNRGITPLHEDDTLRFHPRCYYRPDEHSPMETWPAMIARDLKNPAKTSGLRPDIARLSNESGPVEH